MSRRLNAFTLIELLVVIAIIAILAAILFPVFAQAKTAAKKTASLSNMKQMATAAMIYQTDSDDTFNSTYRNRPGANDTGFLVNTWADTPNGWPQDGVRNTPKIMQECSTHWSNNLLPYIKSGGVYEFPGTKVGSQIYDLTTATGGLKPTNVGNWMNGLLHCYPASAISHPSNIIMFWPGNGARNTPGAAFTNPVLTCDRGMGLPCIYQPNYAVFFGPGENNFWVYGQGANFVYSDTSAKFHHLGSGDASIDPFCAQAYVPGTGQLGPNFCSWVNPSGNPYLFSPDSEF